MLIPALFAVFLVGIDLNDPAPPPNHAVSAHPAPETRTSPDLASEIAELRREVAEIRNFVGKSLGNAIKIELLGREIADLRDGMAELAKMKVQAPPPPAKPKMWYLTDSAGKEWQDPDPENLKRWVRQKNQAAATPKFTAYRTYDELSPGTSFPSQSTAVFQPPASPQVLTPPAAMSAPPVYYQDMGSSWSTPTYGTTYGGSYGSMPSMTLGGGILGGSFLGGGSCVGGSCR